MTENQQQKPALALRFVDGVGEVCMRVPSVAWRVAQYVDKTLATPLYRLFFESLISPEEKQAAIVELKRLLTDVEAVKKDRPNYLWNHGEIVMNHIFTKKLFSNGYLYDTLTGGEMRAVLLLLAMYTKKDGRIGDFNGFCVNSDTIR